MNDCGFRLGCGAISRSAWGVRSLKITSLNGRSSGVRRSPPVWNSRKQSLTFIPGGSGFRASAELPATLGSNFLWYQAATAVKYGTPIPEAIEAITLRPKLIWLQLGVVDDAARARAEAAGLPFVMDRCLAIDHSRLVED